MSLDRKIISEIERYKSIYKYVNEQADPLAAEVPPPPAPAAGAEAVPFPPAPAAGEEVAPPATPEVIDVEADDEVEKIDDKGKSEEGKSDTEELDVTELVDSQKSLETKQDEYFNNLFSQLTNLESKLGEMDGILNRLNAIEAKIEKYREKTPQEKLEMRTYDSYPFNQKLTDFFDDKKEEMELTGKNDYVLTSDEITDAPESEIKKTFLPPNEKI